MTAHVLEQQSPAGMSRQRRGGLLAAGALLAVVLAAHGPALFDGPFFDDHWQGEVLRTGGWGWQDLTRAATFELPGRVNHLWWQDAPLQIRYARPLAMLMMKAEYAATGGDAIALHALGLAWHWLAGLMVYGLARWALRDRRWAFAAAALFVLNPHSVAAVGWIAAHNAIFSGLFLAAAMLVYLRAATVDSDTRSADAAHNGPASISAGCHGPAPLQDHARRPAVGSAIVFCGCLLLWAAAVLCRESAIVFPFLVLVADAGIGGWMQLRRRAGMHATLWLLAAGYIAWRLIIFDAAQPPEPYFHAFDGAGYLAWAASKMLRLLTALVLYTPMFGDLSSGSDWVRSTVTSGLLAGLLLALSWWYFKSANGSCGGARPWSAATAPRPQDRGTQALQDTPKHTTLGGGTHFDSQYGPATTQDCGTRHGPATAQDHGTRTGAFAQSQGPRGRWLWPAWVLAAFAPVVPVIMLPHFAYVSAAGWSIMLAILLSRLAGRKQAIITSLVFAATIWSLGLHRVAWRGIVRSEQIVHAGLLMDEPAQTPGTTVFFINLPMEGIYAPAALRQGWGAADLEGYVLTLAPGVLRAEETCTVEVLGPREILVSVPPPGTLRGASGRMVLDLTRRGKPLEAGTTVHGPAFHATVVDADSAGVRKVKFTFPQPLDSAAYRFYLCSPGEPAERLRFDAPVDAQQRQRQTRQWREANAGAVAEAERYRWLMDMLGRIVRSDVFLTADPNDH